MGSEETNMAMKYGYEQHEWDAAKAEMREALVERAKVRGMIPYSELVEKITTIELEPNSFALAAMLGEVSTEEAEADRGMLSVLVVHKVGDMQPGPGFFELAGELGRDTSDILKCWVDELKKVHRVWSGK
jgi:molybdopterin synthase catalytic subunit